MKTRISLLLLTVFVCFTALVDAQTSTLRFAWLSDTHVGAATGAEDLRAAVRDIRTLPQIDFVIISGDITEFGSDEQLRTAFSILDSLPMPCHVIPGNHDTRWSESGGTTFPRLWGDDRFAFTVHGYRFVGLHQGPRMRMADGYLAPEDLRWLDSVLAAVTVRNQPLFVVTHYPVDSTIANWYALTSRLRSFNVQAILVGHGHANRAADFDGFRGVMGRSTLRADAASGGYTIVTITADSLHFSERRIGTALVPWHCLPVLREPAGFDQPSARPDSSVNDRFPFVRPEWIFRSGYTIASSAALYGNLVLVGDGSGAMRALSFRDGSIQWTFTAPAPIYSSPVAEDGAVVFGCTDGTVYCLEASTGKKRWSVRTAAPVVAAPVAANGTVYCGGSDRVFRSIDLRSGSLRWSFAGLGGFVESRPLVHRNLVMFGAWDGSFYALDAADGSLRWRWSGGKPGVMYSPAACYPVASGARVFLVAPDRMMTALEVETGREVWRSGAYQVRESIGIAEDGDRIFVRTMRDTILALEAGSDLPKVAWATHTGFGYDINSAMLVEKDGMLFYGTKNGLLLALNGKSGAVVWRHRTGDAPINTVTPVDRRHIVVTDLGGAVMLIRDSRRD